MSPTSPYFAVADKCYVRGPHPIRIGAKFEPSFSGKYHAQVIRSDMMVQRAGNIHGIPAMLRLAGAIFLSSPLSSSYRKPSSGITRSSCAVIWWTVVVIGLLSTASDSLSGESQYKLAARGEKHSFSTNQLSIAKHEQMPRSLNGQGHCPYLR
jgi:hypothetical protein